MTLSDLKQVAVDLGKATEAEVAGLDWKALFQLLGPLLLQILAGFLKVPAPMKAKAGCCNHHACCDDVIQAQLGALKVSFDHKLACCDECPLDC